MFAKISLLICLAMTASATDNLQGFVSDTEGLLLGILKGMQPNPDMNSHCIIAGNDTIQYVWDSVDEAVGCITFDFADCSKLFTDLSNFGVQIQNLGTQCKLAELEDKFAELETAAGWSSLGFRYFLNKEKLVQLIQAIPAYIEAGNYQSVGINIGWAFRLVMGFTLNQAIRVSILFFTIKFKMEHKWLERLVEGNCLPEKDLFLLCERVKDILLEENNVNPVNAPVVICGDVHGQFYDLLNLFKTGGSVSETNYVFMGDFVDRGYNSVETVQLLMAYKAAYPDKITLLRGNHESRAVTKVYGFYDECVQKYGNPNPWKYTTDVFDFLPLAAIVDDRVLCIHGGLSPDIRTIDQIRTIDRNMEIPHDGAFSDLMWSDPADIETWEISPRGAGWLFGSRVVEEFNHINGLDLICRAHQLVQDGYRYWYPMKNLVTVWSAPNYCYRCGNMASILKLNEDLERNFAFFEDAPESKRSTHFRNIVPYFL